MGLYDAFKDDSSSSSGKGSRGGANDEATVHSGSSTKTNGVFNEKLMKIQIRKKDGDSLNAKKACFNVAKVVYNMMVATKEKHLIVKDDKGNKIQKEALLELISGDFSTEKFRTLFTLFAITRVRNDKKNGNNKKKITIAFSNVVRISTDHSIKHFKNIPAVHKLLRDKNNPIYIEDHQWLSLQQDISTVGMLTGYNPKYVTIEHATKVVNTEIARLKNTGRDPGMPEYRLVPRAVVARNLDNQDNEKVRTYRANGFTMEVETQHLSASKKALAKLFPDKFDFVHSERRNEHGLNSRGYSRAVYGHSQACETEWVVKVASANSDDDSVFQTMSSIIMDAKGLDKGGNVKGLYKQQDFYNTGWVNVVVIVDRSKRVSKAQQKVAIANFKETRKWIDDMLSTNETIKALTSKVSIKPYVHVPGHDDFSTGTKSFLTQNTYEYEHAAESDLPLLPDEQVPSEIPIPDATDQNNPSSWNPARSSRLIEDNRKAPPVPQAHDDVSEMTPTPTDPEKQRLQDKLQQYEQKMKEDAAKYAALQEENAAMSKANSELQSKMSDMEERSNTLEDKGYERDENINGLDATVRGLSEKIEFLMKHTKVDEGSFSSAGPSPLRKKQRAAPDPSLLTQEISESHDVPMETAEPDDSADF